MTGYDASVLNNPDLRILIIVPNWLGDGIMAMPAIQTLRERIHPEAKLFAGARPGQVGLWEMHSAVTEVLSLPANTKDLLRSVQSLRAHSFTHGFLLPHSFRSALSPALARIPHRRGTVFQSGRSFLINDPVDLSAQHSNHQQWEIAGLILPDPIPEVLPSPRIEPSEEARRNAEEFLAGLPSPILGCIPGAARGPSKQWPGERFQEVAKNWVTETRGSVCWLGTPEDIALCDRLNAPLGKQGISLAGKTNLDTFTALLKKIDLALVNDSGGMHLAAAVDTPLVAIFGNTDPGKTGPLSQKAQVLQYSDQRNRSIDRKSSEAEAALARVTPEEVLEAVLANSLSNA